MNERFDVVIAGAGAVGACTALGLVQQGWRVALLDARAQANTWQSAQYDSRVVAMTWASQQLLQRLGVWDGIALRRISPYEHMCVWDGQGDGIVEFDAADVAHDNLGHIVELSALENSVFSVLSSHKNISVIRGVRAQHFMLNGDGIAVTLDNGVMLSATLLIAADGAQSQLRECAHIDVDENDYAHQAVVAQLQCELPHQRTAYQRFTEFGPLAFLPLSDPNQCSIVWSQTTAQSERVMKLDDRAFEQALATAFEHRLGRLQLCSVRSVFPLKMRHAKHYVAERFVLLGDAAHTMHPLAGQGLNLSLADVDELCAIAARAKARAVDVGLRSTLRPFERRRRGENSAMLFSVGALKALFQRDDAASVLLRNWGLTVVNHSDTLRHFFIAQAMGLYKRS